MKKREIVISLRKEMRRQHGWLSGRQWVKARKALKLRHNEVWQANPHRKVSA